MQYKEIINIVKRFRVALLLLLSLSTYGCNSSEDRGIILISKDSSGEISSWIKSVDSSIITRELYHISEDSMAYFKERAVAIVLGGGADINPSIYKNSDSENLCETPDNFRDSIELDLINYAYKNSLPTLGVCRGQQIINAAFGGTLIRDIPTHNPKSNHRLPKEQTHPITAVDGSWLDTFIESQQSTFPEGVVLVNSRHHQAIDRVADGFKVVAWSSDSIVESIKWSKENRFIVGVQFHPENFKSDPVSIKLVDLFLEAIEK